MKRISVGFNLNRQRQKEDGTYPVRLRITFNRRRKYYTTGIDLTDEGFKRITKGERFSRDEREIIRKLDKYKSKALDVAESLHVFTFEAFEDAFFENRNINKSVSYAFDKYIESLRLQDRIGTAESYGNAKSSLESFKKNLEFAEVTPNFLRRYENWMLENNRSISTVGIYLRSLRAIFNQQGIDKSLYPFGRGKYIIPTSKNIKKALTLEEIQKIYHYTPEPNTYEEMARDYWMFLFISNGMNVKDFCLLRWNNIEGDMITYIREKTKRTNQEQRHIEVALKPETKEIINKWGIRSIQKDAFIFPHLNDKMNAEEQRDTYKQLTKVINDNMKRIARKLDIDKPVTTYYARHSFATILKHSGAGIELISELLGHSDLKVTESYLKSFAKEEIQQKTDVLTMGLKQAK
ncbi:MAG TPA: site-specific integrase [Flavobacteriaceae bacterium]|nr:site-specific integrase [Flavobacteriaceae bacterium]